MLADEPDLGVVAALPRDQAGRATDPWPNVAVIDLDGWEPEGLAAAQRFTSTRPPCRVLALTGQRRPEVLRAILDAGVAGLAQE